MRDPDENPAADADEAPEAEAALPEPSADGDASAEQERRRKRRRRVETLNELPVVDVDVDENEEPTERMSVVSGRIQLIGDSSVVVTERSPEPEASVIIDEPLPEPEASVIIDEPPPEPEASVIIDEGAAEVRRDTDSYETLDEMEIVDDEPSGPLEIPDEEAPEVEEIEAEEAEEVDEDAGPEVTTEEIEAEEVEEVDEDAGPEVTGEEVEAAQVEEVEAEEVEEVDEEAGPDVTDEEVEAEEIEKVEASEEAEAAEVEEVEAEDVDEDAGPEVTDEEGEELEEVEAEEEVEPMEAEEAFSSVPPVTKQPTSTPPPFTKKKVESIPPPPPPAPVSTEQVDVDEDVAPQVLAIPEDDVKRDFKVAVEREALEAAAIEVIPPEFMVEEDDAPKPPRPRPRRPKRVRKWYEEIFGDEYLMNEPKLSDFQTRREIDFVEKGLGLRPGAMILDLACGSGTHAIGMSKRGYQVVGLDYSVAMLAIAGEEAQEHDIKINFLHGDMRDLQFGPTFDGVYCIGTSFGYFDEENNQKVVQGIRKALKPGGVFLLEVDNRDFVMRSQPNLLWYEGDGFICMEETSFDYISSRLTVNRTMLMDEGGKKVSKYSIRVYSLHELGTILHNEGFSVNRIGGHRAAPMAFLGEESPKIIITARKKAEEG